MPWYRGPILLEALESFTRARTAEEEDLRYPVQDRYEMDGRSILVGRVEAGRIRKGDRVTFLPSGVTTRVKSVEKFEKKVDAAAAGESIGITVEDGAKIGRGEVLCPADAKAPVTDRFCADLFWMSTTPLSETDTVNLRCTTQEIGCRIEEVRARIDSSTLGKIERNDKSLHETEVAQVVIRTERPVVVESFTGCPGLGHFVLERGDDVVAGGIVTSPTA
jgi:sulfate adenylyltransferase subunit 1 (EFTu-like GTPase family)